MDEPTPNPSMNDATLLDYFAGQVLTAKRLTHVNFSEPGMAQTAAHAYALAHAMLEARQHHVVTVDPEAAKQQPPDLPPPSPPPAKNPPPLPVDVRKYTQPTPRIPADPVSHGSDLHGPPKPRSPSSYAATANKGDKSPPTAPPVPKP